MEKRDQNIKLTIDDLARMIQADVVLNMATKDDIIGLDGKIGGLRSEMHEGFAQVRVDINHIQNRLTHIDDTLIADHAVRIKRLEEAVL